MKSKSDKSLPVLGPLEQKVLEHLWHVKESDVIETHVSVGSQDGISVNTVGSSLERLFRKGLLMREKVSRAYHYKPAMDREAFQARRLLEAVGGIHSLANQGLLARFVDLVADTDEEILDRLEKLVAKKRSESRS